MTCNYLMQDHACVYSFYLQCSSYYLHALFLTSWLELGPDAIRASKWSLWMRAHMKTFSVGGGAGGGPPHNGWMKPLNCSATSISVVGLRMMLVLRRMDTWVEV